MILSSRQVLWSLAALFVCLVAFELFGIDLLVQRLLFDSQTGTWLLGSAEPLMRFLLYDGFKRLLILFALLVGAVLVLATFSSRCTKYRRGLRIVFFSLLLVPAMVGLGKATTNIPCPRDIAEFGGTAMHTGVLESVFSPSRTDRRYRCFPAGHASGGFALLSLYFLGQNRRQRAAAITLGLSLGWATGIYKMAIGDHFLSHTVVTMIFAWLIINLLAMLERSYSRSTLAARKVQ